MSDSMNDRFISITIVEDSIEYRDILRTTIESEPDMVVDGVYSDAESYLASLDTLHPDVIIMDIHLPAMSGIEAVLETKKRFPRTEVMMCTVFDDDEKVFDSLRAGACGYILKNTPLDQILMAVREVYAGGAPMTPRIARKVLGVFHTDRKHALAEEELTKRELEILHLLGEGKSYQAVCDGLCISIRTVQSHVKNIYSKLQIHSKSEIVAWLAEKRTKKELRRE